MDIMEDLYTTTFSNNEAFFKKAASEIESLRAQVAELKAENERLKREDFSHERVQNDSYKLANKVIQEERDELKRQRDEYKADAEKWRAYSKRKADVIAAGLGRKILRDLEGHDALPAFYKEMKKGETE